MVKAYQMRPALVAATILALSLPALAQRISSVYTEIDLSDCLTFATADADNGIPRQSVCPGYGGYPVLVLATSNRESVYYGFPPHGEFVSRWASFSDPNRMGETIEWRVLTEGERSIPVAAIQRWFIDDPNHSVAAVEVLVV